MAAHALDAYVGGGEPLPMRAVVLRLLHMNDDDTQTEAPNAYQDLPAHPAERAVESWNQWWRSAAPQMWPAWKGLNRWEETASADFEAVLGEFILLLWSVHRFGPGDDGTALFDHIVDDNLHPTFSDPVLEDIVEVAFALGAAWAEDRRRP
jgi:hypothetical protein